MGISLEHKIKVTESKSQMLYYFTILKFCTIKSHLNSYIYCILDIS